MATDSNANTVPTAPNNVGRLARRRALVTGGAGGIGKAISQTLAKEGAVVAIHYNSNEESAKKVLHDIAETGAEAMIVKGDISLFDDVLIMKEEIDDAIGGIEILVNNAGINRDNFFIKMEPIQWIEVMDVNLNGMFNCTKIFIEELTRSKTGRIINISSIVGEMGNVGQTNYATSKAGIIGFTKALARELAGTGVTVNAIAPGFIDTPMVQKVPDKVKERVLSQIPLRRFGKPEEIAAGVVYLCIDDAAYITGQVLNINGGMYI